jgi:hypothetical protein
VTILDEDFQMKRFYMLMGGWLLLCCSGISNAAIIEFQVNLDGSQEVSSGDPDGTGIASLFIDDQAMTIDWMISVSNIDLPLIGAHIHNAAAGANGSVVVDFSGQLSGTNLNDADLANVLLNPTNFYVNLHNSVFPGGAIRGQLAAPVPLPASLPLLLSGLGWLALKRGRQV